MYNIFFHNVNNLNLNNIVHARKVFFPRFYSFIYYYCCFYRNTSICIIILLAVYGAAERWWMIKTAGLMKKKPTPFFNILRNCAFAVLSNIRTNNGAPFTRRLGVCVRVWLLCVYYKIFHYKVQFRRLQTSTNMLLYTIIIKENSLTQ